MFEKIKKYFTDKRDRKRLQEETFFADIWALGFKKIQFPIIIQDGLDLSIVDDKMHFFGDPDIYFFEYDKSMRLIDSLGRQFTWGYSIDKKSNYPDKLVRELTVDEIKEIAKQYFKDVKKKPDLEHVQTVQELIEKIKGFL